MAGDVMVNGEIVFRAGASVRETDAVELRSKPRFVSRAGDKLAHALVTFGLEMTGRVCADIGASTGGFTDCLVQAGATRVYAIDVGYGQLDLKLRDDPRVVTIERTNARYLEGLPESVSLVAIDVSFISLRLILPVAARLLAADGRCVPLVKPQFEAGRSDVKKGGVVRDANVHRRVLIEVLEHAQEIGFLVEGLTKSPLTGPAGNIEFLACLRRATEAVGSACNVAELVDQTVAR